MPVQGDDLFSLLNAGKLAVLEVPGAPASVKVADGLPEEILVRSLSLTASERHMVRPSAGSAFYIYAFGPSTIRVGLSGRAYKRCDGGRGSLASLYDYYDRKRMSGSTPPSRVVLTLPDMEIEGYVVDFSASGDADSETYGFSMTILTVPELVKLS